MTHREIANPRPVLKWAGGKRALIPQILAHIPTEYNRYYEPFIGGAALFLALDPKEATLSDLNADLINTYAQIKDNPQKLIKALKLLKYTKEDYYAIREQKLRSNVKKAAQFIYLNRTCWNGLFRVNSLGKFNVPIGKYHNPTICDSENITAVEKRLKKAQLVSADFEIVLETAEGGDFVYLDPPYVTSHNNNGFIEYNAKIFSLKDQERLAEVMSKLTLKGCKILMSNAAHQVIRDIYHEFTQVEVSRQSLICRNAESRGIVTELLIKNY